MESVKFIRKPFPVYATEITEENIHELARFIGTIQTKQDGTVYIQVDRRLVPNVFRVYVGFWMTKMDENVRCYPRPIFEKLFVKSTPEIEAWVAYLDGNAQETAGQLE